MRSLLALAAGWAVVLTSSITVAQTMPRLEHRFEGLVTDAFMSDDGALTWTCEDGGRVRFRNGTAPWVYLDTPNGVRSTIRAIHFVKDPSTGWATPGILNGWMVGDDAGVWTTSDGGASWMQVVHGPPNPVNTSSYTSHLRDVYFISGGSSGVGWILGLHGIWKSDSGGAGLIHATILDQGGTPLDMTGVELYAMDVLECAGSDPIVVACGEPGYVLRSLPPTATYGVGEVFQVVWSLTDHCDEEVPNCGNGAWAPMMGQALHDAVCGHEPAARFEPWDIEFQRKCSGGEPVLVMVGGIGAQLGAAFSSMDYGDTFVRECHECEVTPSLCTPNPDYEFNQFAPLHYYRHKNFKSLYGVAVFGDGSAVGGGYNGQHLARQTNGVWVDRSQFSPFAMEVTDEASLFTFNGAASQRNASSSISNGAALLVGQGGQARGTTNAIAAPTPPPPVNGPGENWTETTPQAGWWRLAATSFNTSLRGWRTGQLYHIALTIDGGLTWDMEKVSPYGNANAFHSIAVSPNTSPDDGSGVAVGYFDIRELPGVTGEGCSPAYVNQPKILIRSIDTTVMPPTIRWIEPTFISWLNGGAKFKSLHDVCWAETVTSGDVYWTCGDGETILHSVTGGAVWTQAPYPSGTATIRFNALAFISKSEGVFVGRNPSTGVASAYGVHASPSGYAWDNIAPTGVIELFDVAFDGTTAYAVGSVNTLTGVEGRVFSSTLSAGTFSPFAAITGPTNAVRCTIGDALDGPPLESIAVATNGDLWVGGECGRVWRRSSGTWTEMKSQTDGHIVDLEPAPDGYIYGTSSRMNLTGPGLVRWKP